MLKVNYFFWKIVHLRKIFHLFSHYRFSSCYQKDTFTAIPIFFLQKLYIPDQIQRWSSIRVVIGCRVRLCFHIRVLARAPLFCDNTTLHRKKSDFIGWRVLPCEPTWNNGFSEAGHKLLSQYKIPCWRWTISFNDISSYGSGMPCSGRTWRISQARSHNTEVGYSTQGRCHGFLSGGRIVGRWLAYPKIH